LIGEQFSEPGDRVAHNPAKHVVEVFPRVDAESFARLDQPEVKSGCPSAAITGGKQPVLPSQGQGPDGVLSQVVVGPEAAVLQVTVKGLFLVQGIVDGFPKGLRRKGCNFEFIQPVEDPIENRPGYVALGACTAQQGSSRRTPFPPCRAWQCEP
jgi:hypothetical protein